MRENRAEVLILLCPITVVIKKKATRQDDEACESEPFSHVYSPWPFPASCNNVIVILAYCLR